MLISKGYLHKRGRADKQELKNIIHGDMLKTVFDRDELPHDSVFTRCVFLLVRARLCTDLLPAGSRAAGYIHVGLVGQVPAYRSCNRRTKRHFTRADYRSFPSILQSWFLENQEPKNSNRSILCLFRHVALRGAD